MEGLSPSLSVVGFVDGESVGLVLTGIRIIDGKKVAWNGGTGVATEYRKQGVGREMMKALLDIYQQEGVDIAILEAFKQNEKAIALYQQVGYDVIDQLLFLQHSGPFAQNPFACEGEKTYRLKKGIPQDVRHLAYYNSMAPWQTQWAGIRDGESVQVQDEAGAVVGYALYKRGFDDAGKQISISLFQCAAAPDRNDADQIIKTALSHVFGPFDQECRRATFNFPASQEQVVRILEEAGFAPSTEQVYMMKTISR